MKNLILSAVIIALSCCGLYSATLRKMILNKPAEWLKKKLPIFLYKPICGCLICMSSFWSCVFWILFRSFEIIYLPVIILMVAGLNTIVVSLISNIIPDEETD